MTSEIRANTIKNRVGLGTVSYTDTGIVVSGIVTANSFSGPISATTGNFSDALTISSTTDQMLNLNSSDNNGTSLAFQRNGSRQGYIGYGGASAGLIIANEYVNGAVAIQGNDGGSIINMLSFATDNKGLATLHGGATIPLDLDVDGHTNLDNISVAGVSTFSSNITLPNNISMFFGDGGTKIFGTAGGGASNGLRFFTDSGGSLFIDGNHNVYVQQGNLSVTGTISATSTVYIPDAIEHSGDSNTKIRFPAADTFSVETAGTERLRITSGGAVGIRTDNPTATFHVRGHGVFTQQTGGTITNGLFLDAGDTGAGNRPDIVLKGSGSSALNNLAMQVYYNNGSDKAFHLRYDGGTYHLGNIGIGVENPLTFDTTADDLVISRSVDAGITISVGNAGTTNTASILFAEGTAGTQDKARGAIKYKHGDDYLAFHTNYNEQLRLDANGRLKVGNNVRPASDANEGAQLRVAGAPLTRNQYYSPYGQYFGSIGYADNSNTKVWLAVDSGYAQSSAVSAGIFLSAFHQDAGGSGCGFTIKNLKDGNPLVISSVTTAASTGNPAVENERIRITAAGNVGINSTSPAHSLDVYGNIRASVLYLNQHGSPTVNIVSTSDTGGGSIYFGSPASGIRGGILYNHSNDQLKLRNIYGTSILIDNSRKSTFYGDIHMLKGSGEPAATLTLQTHDTANSIAKINLMARDNSNNNETCYIEAKSGGSAAVDLRFGTGSGEHLRITRNGQLWLYADGGDNQFNSKRTGATSSNGDYFYHLNAINNGDTTVGTLGFHRDTANDSSRFIIKTRNNGGSNSERLRIDSSGNVSINGDGTNTIPRNLWLYHGSNDPYFRIQRGSTGSVIMGGIEIASSNGNGNNVLSTMYTRATGNSGTTGATIFQVRDQANNYEVVRLCSQAQGAIQGNRMLVNGNQVMVFGGPLGTSGTHARTGNTTTYNSVYEHSSSSYRTSDNGMFGGTFVVSGNANYWYPVWFSLPTNCPPQELWVNKYVHNYATWDGTLFFRASLSGTGYGAYTVQHRVHFYSSSNHQFIGKIIYTGHNNAFIVLWMKGGGRSYGWGTVGGNGITVNVGDDGNSHNLGPGNGAETYITNNLTIPQGYEQAMTTSGQHQQSDGF